MASKPNNGPAIFIKPTLLIPAMADWTPERVELSREPETQVWEGPKTVVEIPWWLHSQEPHREPTGITKQEPIRALRPRVMAPQAALSIPDDRDLIDTDTDTVPAVLSFTPFFQRSQLAPEEVFEDTLPLDPFPRRVTSYDVKIVDAPVVDAEVVDSPFEDTEEVVVPLPRVTPAPRLRAGRLGLLSLLILALGTLVAATFKVFNLFPRLQP